MHLVWPQHDNLPAQTNCVAVATPRTRTCSVWPGLNVKKGLCSGHWHQPGLGADKQPYFYQNAENRICLRIILNPLWHLISAVWLEAEIKRLVWATPWDEALSTLNRHLASRPNPRQLVSGVLESSNRRHWNSAGVYATCGVATSIQGSYSERISHHHASVVDSRRRSRILVRGAQRSFDPRGPEPKICSK